VYITVGGLPGRIGHRANPSVFFAIQQISLAAKWGIENNDARVAYIPASRIDGSVGLFRGSKRPTRNDRGKCINRYMPNIIDIILERKYMPGHCGSPDPRDRGAKQSGC
jgi:hypothetical protein